MGVLVFVLLFLIVNFIIIKFTIIPFLNKLSFPKNEVQSYILRKNEGELIDYKILKYKDTLFYNNKKYNLDFFKNRIIFFRISVSKNNFVKDIDLCLVKPFKFFSKKRLFFIDRPSNVTR